MRLRFRIALFITLAALTQAAVCVSAAAQKPRYQGLTILHTNDIHGHLFEFDYRALGKDEKNVGGAARRATLIRDIKAAEKRPVIYMDAGDLFMRGPLGDLGGAPDFDVMNAIPCDVMTLGNNEFKGNQMVPRATTDDGIRILAERMRSVGFPIVCANVVRKSDRELFVPASVVIERNGLKVGVFGLTAPRVAVYPEAASLDILDYVQAARKAVADLKGKCDLIVALTHIGYELDPRLAEAVPEIDVIIGGDSHTWLFEPALVARRREGEPEWSLGRTLVCQAGEWGKCVGRLDLSLRLAPDGAYRVMGYSAKMLEVNSSVAPAEDVARIVWRYAKPFYREVGVIDREIPIAAAPQWIAQALRQVAGAQVGVRPIEGIESGLPAGPVNQLDIRKMVTWNNPVVRLSVTGKQLLECLSNPGLALAGVKDVAGLPYVDGERVLESGRYTLAIEDFFARTSPALAGSEQADTGLRIREILAIACARKPRTLMSGEPAASTEKTAESVL